MVEIKQEEYPDPERQNDVLKEAFSPLTPLEDYHFLSLHTEMFDKVSFAPRKSFLPVAFTNLEYLSRVALERGYGGVNGHYLLMTKRRIENHRGAGQQVGTGYTRSKFCLFRELNRGVRWIYSNHADRVQKIRDRCLEEADHSEKQAW